MEALVDTEEFGGQRVTARPEVPRQRHLAPEAAGGDRRFAGARLSVCVHLAREIAQFQRAATRLSLQAQAILRAWCGGSKTEAGKHWAALRRGKWVPPPGLLSTLEPFLAGIATFEAIEAARKKELGLAARGLPGAGFAASVRGLSLVQYGQMIGETGDLAAYDKGLAGVWKRAGLGLVGETRQRRVRDVGQAALHGYSPRRRALFWLLGDTLLRAQGRDATAGPYRKVYDHAKAAALAKGWTAGHAHSHARRVMVKALLRDLRRAWKRDIEEGAA